VAGGSDTKAVLTVGATLDKGSVGATFGKLRREQDKLTASIADTKLEQKALRVQMRGLKKDSAELKTLDAKYKSLGDSIKRDELAVISLQRQQAKLAKTPTGASKWGSMKSALGKAGAGMASLGRAAAIGGGVVAGAAVAGLAAIEKMAVSMDETAKAARSFGVSTDELQGLRYAAQRGGMTVQKFDKAFQTMARGIGEGSSEAKKATQTLGLSMGWLKKQSPDKQLEAVAERLNAITDPGQRITLAKQLFGAGGARGMLNMLEGGAQALRGLKDEANRKGLIIPEADLHAAETFNDDLLNLKTAAFAALAPLAAKLMPQVIEQFRSGVNWVVENKDSIMEFGSTAAEYIGNTIGIASQFVGTLAKIGGSVADLMGGWENLTAVVGAFWLAMKVGALSNPVTAALMGIGLAITALITHWDDLGRSFSYVWEQWLAPWLQGMRDKLQSMLDVLNKIPGINLSLPNVTRPLPATETGGGVAPALAAAAAGAGTTVHQTNVNHFDGKIDRREAERLAREANRDAAERLQTGGLFSPAPGV